MPINYSLCGPSCIVVRKYLVAENAKRPEWFTNKTCLNAL